MSVGEATVAVGGGLPKATTGNDEGRILTVPGYAP